MPRCCRSAFKALRPIAAKVQRVTGCCRSGETALQKRCSDDEVLKKVAQKWCCKSAVQMMRCCQSAPETDGAAKAVSKRGAAKVPQKRCCKSAAQMRNCESAPKTALRKRERTEPLTVSSPEPIGWRRAVGKRVRILLFRMGRRTCA